MRIISGYLKGRKITQPKDRLTRPLKDLTKESIFNIIKHSNLINFDLKKSKNLDLFSGVGAFGLECVSRGAKNVTFCENYPESIKVLKRNILNFECQNKTEIIVENIFNIKNLTQFYNKKFEIIFLDPPFANSAYLHELKLIKQKKNYKKNHIIIIHRERKSFENFGNILNPIIIKQYGRSKIIFGKFLR